MPGAPWVEMIREINTLSLDSRVIWAEPDYYAEARIRCIKARINSAGGIKAHQRPRQRPSRSVEISSTENFAVSLNTKGGDSGGRNPEHSLIAATQIGGMRNTLARRGRPIFTKRVSSNRGCGGTDTTVVSGASCETVLFFSTRLLVPECFPESNER